MDIFGAAIHALKPALGDDFVDRANYFYTPWMLLIMAVTISTRQWIGQPIECWVPAEFKHAWEEYTENVCYVQDTYWLPMEQPVALGGSYAAEKRISYYQWVPFILGAQALMFCLPFALWRFVHFRSGFNVHTVVAVARDCALLTEPQDESAKVDILAEFVKDVLWVRTVAGRHGCWSPFERGGFSLTIMYTVVKLLYVVNAILQIVFLEGVLSTGGRLGTGVFFNLLSGVGWHQSGTFPRVTLCEFDVRLLGNVNKYTVQCVLMINMFNERIFLLVWIWVVALLLLNVAHLFRWVPDMTLGPSRRGYICGLLRVKSLAGDGPINVKAISGFVNSFLKADGALLIRKVADYAGDVVASHLVHRLYCTYVTEKRLYCDNIEKTDKSAYPLYGENKLLKGTVTEV